MKLFISLAVLCGMLSIETTAQPADTLHPVVPHAVNLTISPRYLSPKTISLPAMMLVYGFAGLSQDASIYQLNKSTSHEIREHNPVFRTQIDNYLQFAPAAGVYLLNASGVKGRHNFKDRTIIYAISSAIMMTAVFTLKNATHSERPDGSAHTSFPSGHTAEAFAGAEFLHQEYNDRSSWYGYAGYPVAAVTGGLRLFNNKHWLSDIVGGAAIGILSTKAAYWVFDHWIRKSKQRDPVPLY